MRLFLYVCGMAALVGCTEINFIPAVQVRARNEMRESKAAYQDCLRKNPQNMESCEAYRKIYEADLRAYRATMGGTITVEETK